jgi:hypothetical protein
VSTAGLSPFCPWQPTGTPNEYECPQCLYRITSPFPAEKIHRHCPLVPRPPEPPPEPAAGPGTELKKLLARFGIVPEPGCLCNARAFRMDTMGPEWCERHINVIVTWLGEEAARRNLPFIRLGAKILVLRAIRNARKTMAADAARTMEGYPRAEPRDRRVGS